MILAMNEKYNNFFNDGVEEIEVTPADYSKCLSFSEACYTAMMEDYQNWDNFEKSIIYYEVSAAEAGERIKYTGRQIKAMAERVIEIIKKFIEKVMGILKTWKQRVNIAIAQFSEKFIMPKDHKAMSEEVEDYDWKSVLGKVMSIDYMIATSEDEADKTANGWVRGSENVSAGNIIDGILSGETKAKRRMSADEISKELKAARPYVESIYNNELKIKRICDKQISEMNKHIKEADKEMDDDKAKRFHDIANGYRASNKYNNILMNAQLNIANEYIKSLGRFARNFKSAEKKGVKKESVEMFGNFKLV